MVGFEELANALVDLLKTVDLPNGKPAFTSVKKRVRPTLTGERIAYIDLDIVPEYKEVLRDSVAFMKVKVILTLAVRDVNEDETSSYLLVDRTLNVLRRNKTLNGLVKQSGLTPPYINFNETSTGKKYYVGQIHLAYYLQR